MAKHPKDEVTPLVVTGTKLSAIAASGANAAAADRFVGVHAGTTDLLFSLAQIQAGMALFSSTTQGEAPASGGGTTNFLRADGTWAAPPGGGGGITGGVAHGVAITNTATSVASNVVLGANQLLIGAASADPVAAAVSGDLTNSAGAFTISAGAVTNAKQSNMAAWTLKGNVSSSAAAPTDFTIDGLTLKASPVAGTDEVILWDVAGAAIKKAQWPVAGGGGLPLIGTGATVTASAPLLDLSQTWNGDDVSFTGIRANFTNTASTSGASGSNLIDLQIGGTSNFRVIEGGGLYFDAANNGIVNFGATGGFNPLGLSVNAAPGNTGAFTTASGFIGWYNADSPFSSMSNVDIRLCRDAAGIIGQRITTGAQTFRVYNTFTDLSNYERGVIDWTTTANTLTIGAQAAGTGVLRTLVLTAGTKAGAPVAADIPVGTWALIRDTSGNTTKLYYNNAGTLQSVALA